MRCVAFMGILSNQICCLFALKHIQGNIYNLPYKTYRKT